MSLATLPPRQYRALDRLTKLAALVLLTSALVPGALTGLVKLACGLVGVVLGVLTVFVDVAEDASD
ncbi:hypothetical protein GCM10009037_11120 [Halarchaeum grantii]|uniref:DUF8120 domain-containing protein n=1 Tax=Halarchaeum grantii TaxID=1193105 RepID=A0A830F8D1_9EURY|nr:hypothetical protein [Halarchaeum grantii]GGL29188.1 hypothetical protein GCM10009037_11120 [Halarchaeum grantii]